MLYVIKQGILSYEHETNENHGDSVAIINRQEMLEELHEADAFDVMINKALNNDTIRYEGYEQMDICCIAMHGDQEHEIQHVMHIFMQQHCLWIVCEQNETLTEMMEMLMAYDKHTWTLETLLFHLLERILQKEMEKLDQLQEAILHLEQQVIQAEERPDMIKAITQLRTCLLKQKRLYEQCGDVFAYLLLNENRFYTAHGLNMLHFIQRHYQRLSQRIDMLQDYVSEIREAYQAQVDIDLSTTMRIFTVITAVFLPLSLIVGWYGMNFAIPEYDWPYGYVMVIVLSIVMTICLLLWFKRKRWF